MEVYTIGFAKKSAAGFFGALSAAGIRRLLDIRLNNTSQLAGFTKRDDLAYFVRQLCGADYCHEPLLAPSAELFADYKKHGVPWAEYEARFLALLAARRVEDSLDRDLFVTPTALLCTEPLADRCHRRLVAEYLQSRWGGFGIVHL